MTPHGQEWQEHAHVDQYREYADTIPHRGEGETVVVELLPKRVRRVLDIGTGDGRLLSIVLAARPGAEGIGLDFSPPMLAAASKRVTTVEHDFSTPLPDLGGAFDAIVSSFAIHHVDDARKQELYREVFALLEPGGIFLNLEHVASATPRLHTEFYDAIGQAAEDDDPSNQLALVEDQLDWLRGIGFDDVDCMWKWRELALLQGRKPA
ncbi:MAG: tRNA (cmo5U34)-methyltransferase [Thermoleophilaceae bacterium]|nr:tRNA (cmo5U34)-methyltransferase [Thermoleophilaceae bacterium]